MPAEDCLGSHYEQMLPPSRVEAAHDQPEESISALEPRMRLGAECYLELVA
jgi:hypothetical protein